MHPYQDRSLDIESRLTDLLARMTLEEKAHELSNDAPANERLGIPRMNHGEILHGVMWRTAYAETDPERYEGVRPTVFPQTIAMGCTFNPDLIERMATVIAREARALDRHHCYSPNLDIACDPRFGRVEENFGEDPHLVSRLGVAVIHGFQGRGSERFDSRHVLATAKHFAGYGLVTGGINGAEVNIGERALREVHLPPFEAAVREARIGSVMPSHHAQEGIPCHCNRWLLHDVLRREWGFDGIIASDNSDIYRLYGMHRVASDRQEAAVMGVGAGVDLDLQLQRLEHVMCYNLIPKLVEEGRISATQVDELTRRVLRAKFTLGLFDNVDREDPRAICCSAQHRELAREGARASHVLLTNDGMLPLNPREDTTIALIGPHADICHLGGYVGDLVPETVTPAQGMRKLMRDPAKLKTAQGCLFGVEEEPADEDAMIAQAVETAATADLVILALGGTRKTCGEGVDNADIRLPGRQHELAHGILDCGKPTALLLVGGRPWALADIAERCQAILLAWYGGCEAGTAIAESLFGVNNPGGKLSMSFPRSVGHIPCSYLRRPGFTGSGHDEYRQHGRDALFPFGHGLSYTTFSYSPVSLSAQTIGPCGEITAEVTVTNTGDRAGDEVVQCYVSDETAGITPFLKQLRGFRRVHLKAGESQQVRFTLGPDELAIWNVHMERVVEPGWFTVQMGGSSAGGETARFAVVDPTQAGLPVQRADAIVLSREQDMEVAE